MMCNDEPMFVNHCAYTEPNIVNRGMLYWAGGCESWCLMLRQLLWVMVSYTKPVVVSHGV